MLGRTLRVVFNLKQPMWPGAITLSGDMPKPKANDHIQRITYLRRLSSSADDMHTETARLVNELTTSPRVAKSAAVRIKRLEGIARRERTRGKP
jgi:hypothetical protein